MLQLPLDLRDTGHQTTAAAPKEGSDGTNVTLKKLLRDGWEKQITSFEQCEFVNATTDKFQLTDETIDCTIKAEQIFSTQHRG